MFIDKIKKHCWNIIVTVAIVIFPIWPNFIFGETTENTYLTPFIQLDFPVNILVPPDGTNRTFIVEHTTGEVKVIKENIVLEKPFLDIKHKLRDKYKVDTNFDMGLMAVAFPPQYPQKKKVYVSYSDKDNFAIVSSFKVAQNLSHALVGSEQIILKIQTKGWHFCGPIVFHPKNGYLYICLGDGGTPENAQDLSTLLGS